MSVVESSLLRFCLCQKFFQGFHQSVSVIDGIQGEMIRMGYRFVFIVRPAKGLKKLSKLVGAHLLFPEVIKAVAGALLEHLNELLKRQGAFVARESGGLFGLIRPDVKKGKYFLKEQRIGDFQMRLFGCIRADDAPRIHRRPSTEFLGGRWFVTHLQGELRGVE
ncbi:hypothetical protein [Desulfosoma caldarium]|uniref:hypothetical protein n=1 Tax=Desulfosoma caldarium TaxID=610254 RepID=UPI001475033D|nr:hypothetical protein [Desulfosoma caldarium]